jgi:acyl-CoA dehydrogenase
MNAIAMHTPATPTAAMPTEPADDTFANALQVLLAAHCPPAVVRAVERGDSDVPGQVLWKVLDDSGFANAMLPESLGGAGLTLAQAFPLFELCGRFLVPLPLAETLLVRAWAAARGMDPPTGCEDLDWVKAAAQVMPQGPVPETQPSFQAENQPDTQALRAAVLAAQMAGAMQRVLEMTLQFANERQQFGRPLGKFQAIQHQLALMAEHCLAAHMAAQIGCTPMASAPAHRPVHRHDHLPDRLRAGIAKARASEAAVEVAALAHSIHGAIGFTEAFDLQLFTRRLHSWRQMAGAESYWHREIGEALLAAPQGLALDALRQVTDSA